MAAAEVGRCTGGVRWRRLDVFDWITLAAFAAIGSMTVLVLLRLERSLGLVWTGTDGPYLGDQAQYLGWISDASDNGLIGNPFQLGPREQTFLHPGLLVSGALHRLGAPTSIAYLVWKPVAIGVLFVAFRLYVDRLVSNLWGRRIALVLSLMAVPALYSMGETVADVFGPTAAFHTHTLSMEMWPGLYLSGYPFTAIAVAAMPIALLGYGRTRRTSGWPWVAPLALFLCTWLQPWQGATVSAVLVLTELVLWRRTGDVRIRQLVLTVSAALVPVVYYASLSALDPTWQLAGSVNRPATLPLGATVGMVTTFGFVGLLDLRRPARSFHDIALRWWPLCSILVFWTISYSPGGTFPLHAVQGMSLPLVVLAVRGMTNLRLDLHPVLRGVAVIGVVVVAVVHPVSEQYTQWRDQFDPRGPQWVGTAPFFIERDEQDALDHLASRTSGGVLARVHLGQLVPGLTGRPTWVGIASWTPDYEERSARAQQLFSGSLPRPDAVAFVRSTGARWLLGDCASVDLDPVLAELVVGVRRFGCAAVYEVSG